MTTFPCLSAEWISITGRWGIYITSLFCLSSVFTLISPSVLFILSFSLFSLFTASFSSPPFFLSSPSVHFSLHFVTQITLSLCHLFPASPLLPTACVRLTRHRSLCASALCWPSVTWSGGGLSALQIFSVCDPVITADPESHRQHKASVAPTVCWLHSYRNLARVVKTMTMYNLHWSLPFNRL